MVVINGPLTWTIHDHFLRFWSHLDGHEEWRATIGAGQVQVCLPFKPCQILATWKCASCGEPWGIQLLVSCNWWDMVGHGGTRMCGSIFGDTSGSIMRRRRNRQPSYNGFVNDLVCLKSQEFPHLVSDYNISHSIVIVHLPRTDRTSAVFSAFCTIMQTYSQQRGMNHWISNGYHNRSLYNLVISSLYIYKFTCIYIYMYYIYISG